MNVKNFLLKLCDGVSLSRLEMKDAVNQLFKEITTESEVAAFLTALKLKGETVDEITGLVEALREKAMPISTHLSGIMDNCGTGGDGSQSFNISTTTSFVLAGAGVKVAKHGNRSVSSKTGSADVLEELGVALDFNGDEVEELLDTNGIAFLFAPHVHSQLKKVMQVRKQLKIPTIFNLIGPLTNPVTLDTQLLGVYRRDMIETMALVLKQLGRKRAIVLNGAGYMDEASLAGENHLVLVEEGEISTFTISPEDIGLSYYPLEKIKGGDAIENARILVDVLKGNTSPYLDTTLLNAAIALYASGKAATVKEGVELARHSIESGAAYEKLQNLIKYSQNNRKRVVSNVYNPN